MREALGSTWDGPLFTNALVHVQFYRGAWDDAVAEANTALRMMDAGAAKGSGSGPTPSWATPTEREVVTWAAQGLTNSEIASRLYVSHRIVGTHLSHLYRKLGIRTRTEQAAAAAPSPNMRWKDAGAA